MAKKQQHYMTERERYKLEGYLEAGKSIAWIAKELGFCRQTIYNERKRGMYIHTHDLWDEVRYSADKAQQIHNYNQTAKGRPLKIGHAYAYAHYLEQKIMQERFSPAAALAAARKDGFACSVCITTLYRYIHGRVFLHLTCRNLWQKGRKHRTRKCPRIAHPKLPSIVDRPEYINQRSELGHWEMDLIIGKANTTACLLTLTERCTRQELIFKLPNRKASTICRVFDRLERNHPDFRKQFKTITTDNGVEFLKWEQLRTSIHGGIRFEIYYCHSYAAWEKGTNENHNRMIRRWFPKGTDFTRVTKKQVAAVQEWMNNYPRRVLQWKTPNELVA